MEQKQSDDPVKSPVIQEIIMSNRIGAISVELAKRLNIEPVKALQLFYESQTCADLHDKSTGLYLYGDLYVADEFMRERGRGGVTVHHPSQQNTPTSASCPGSNSLWLLRSLRLTRSFLPAFAQTPTSEP